MCGRGRESGEWELEERSVEVGRIGSGEHEDKAEGGKQK